VGKAEEGVAGERREAEAARAEAEAALREIAAKKRREVEVFARELRRRGEEAERKAAEAIREAVAKVETAQRAASAAPRLRGEAVQKVRAAQDEVLKDPALDLPQETETPGAPLVLGGRVKTRTLGITGELIAFHGQDEAEVAVSGKRLRVARAELVAVAGGPGKAARKPEPSPAAS